MKALILTEDTAEEAILAQTLRLAGLTVSTGHNLENAQANWTLQSADLLIIALRVNDYLEMVRTVGRLTIVSFIVVTDALTEDQHLDLLDAGADMVFERPCSMRLLLGYAKTLMRRTGRVSRRSLPDLYHEEVRLDPSNRTVQVGDMPAHRLSQLEFRLLHTLMIHQGQVLTTTALVDHVWGYTGQGDRDLVRGLIKRLRAKVEPNPRNPQYIRTIQGVGYTFGTGDSV